MCRASHLLRSRETGVARRTDHKAGAIPCDLGKVVTITGARIALGARTAIKADLWVTRGRLSLSPVRCSISPVLDLSGYLVLPGLINAHDHLELNLFPNLGCGVYPDATAWAEDIYHPRKSPIKEQLAVPKSARLRWGAIKNLLSGVTTVAHHNPLPPAAIRKDLPVRLVSRFGWAHSLRFCPDWPRRSQATSRRYPFIIHAAEGITEAARREITMLESAGALHSSTVLVHGVAIGRKQLAMVSSAGCSLVWCPSSNHFTLGRTLDREILGSGVPIALGSDSAMTAKGDLLDELRFAGRTVPAERLYDMVTSTAARILKLPSGFGEIRDGGPADLLVVRDDGATPARSLLRAVPKLVMVAGRIELVCTDCGIRGLEKSLDTRYWLTVGGRGAYFLSQPVESLVEETRGTLREEIKLSGKVISSWQT
ncbi:MAG: amidohydrolase family protein [Bryobacteraceae bacterium]